MIGERLSSISSSEAIFNESVGVYKALKESGYKENVKFVKKESKETGRKRRRKVVWYNPPFNAAIKTNLGKQFLMLIDRHYPRDRPRADMLHKIINRHTLKLYT